MPSVSCIMPVYNGERFLSEALDSILSQTCPPCEIIVVDDGSTDRTEGVAGRYSKHIRCARQANQGAASAKNHGLSEARGEYVAFLDADDIWHPRKLEHQLIRMRERPAIDLCFTQFQNFWMSELQEEAKGYQGHPMSQPSSAWSIGTLVARRAAFDEFGPFDEGRRGNENMLWFLRAARLGAVFDVVEEVLMYRRFHSGNDTRRSLDHNIDLFLPILKAWRDYRRESESS